MAHYYQIGGYDPKEMHPLICRTEETFRDNPRFYNYGQNGWVENYDLWWHTFMNDNDWEEITEQQAFDILNKSGVSREAFDSE